MRKLKLDLDRLAVESFAADAALAGRGTVRGRSEPTSFPNPCDSDVSVCNMCHYTANPCECQTGWC